MAGYTGEYGRQIWEDPFLRTHAVPAKKSVLARTRKRASRGTYVLHYRRHKVKPISRWVRSRLCPGHPVAVFVETAICCYSR